MLKTAYDEGFNDRLCGQTKHQNPYAAMTKEFSEWLEGWTDQDHHLKARDEALDSIGWFG